MVKDTYGRKAVFSGIKSQTLVTIIMGVVEMVFFSVMSRILSQEDFGYYAIITAVTVVLTTITEAGMGSTLIQRKNPSEQFISTAFTISFGIGTISSLFLLLTAPLFSRIMTGEDSLTLAFRLMALPLLLSNVNSIARATMMRKLNFFKFGVFQIIAFVISNSIAVFVALKGYGFYAIITGAVLNQLFMTVLLYTFSHYTPKFRVYRQEVKSIVVFGGWLTGSAIIRSITDQLDKFILTRWMSVSALGAYNRPAGFISSITGKIYGIFDIVLYPILSGIQDEEEKMKRSYFSSVVLTTLFSCLLMAVFILGSKLIITIFFGSSWLNLTGVFQLLSLSIIALSYSRIADVFFRSIGIVKEYFWNRVITCILTVICLYIGCHYGLVGAAVAFTVSKIIDVIVKVIMLRKRIVINRFSLYKEMLYSCLLPLLLMMLCLPLLLIDNGSLIAVLVFCISIVLFLVFKPSWFGHLFEDYIYKNYIQSIKEKFFSKLVK